MVRPRLLLLCLLAATATCRHELPAADVRAGTDHPLPSDRNPDVPRDMIASDGRADRPKADRARDAAPTDARRDTVCTPSCLGKCPGAGNGCGGKCPGNDCNGCCDAANACQAGTTTAQCGSKGEACSACAPPQPCVGGTCTCVPSCAGKCKNADDGCGGSCASQVCTGCCTTSQMCLAGDTDQACGSGGVVCVDCAATATQCDTLHNCTH